LSNILGDVPTQDLFDFYQIYLWNYCAGNTTNGVDTITYCSPRKADFVFNPIQEWDLNNTIIEKEVPKAVNSAVDAYTKSVKFMFSIYSVAIITTAVSIVVGLFAICSRIGSCVTTIFVSAATLFTFVAALTSTVIYSILVGAFNTSLKPYNIHSSVGTSMFAVDWIAVAFSAGATIFWTFSICCVSGKSNGKNTNKMTPMGYGPFNTATARGYQPVESPLLNQPSGYHGTNPEAGAGVGAGPFHGRDTAYEPFRHQNV